MQRVKNVDYDEDELYDDDDEYGEEAETYSQEDRGNFAALTPVVRAELEEVGLQASDKEIQDALWNYYWDVAKAVTYLKNNRTPKPQQQTLKKQERPKSKFDEAAERSAKGLGESGLSFRILSCLAWCGRCWSVQDEEVGHVVKIIVESPSDGSEGTPCMLPPRDWFRDVPWTLPPETQGHLVPAAPVYRPRLLGGSSKLAKPTEERGKKLATAGVEESSADGASSSLDHPTKPKEPKENEAPLTVGEPRNSQRSEKREPKPPPSSGLEEEKPDLRAQPTAFARTLSARPTPDTLPAAMSFLNLLASERSEDPFKGPSPDGTVTKAQNRSKGMTKRPLANKTQALKLDPTSTQATQPKVRSKGLDVPRLWAEERARRKPSAAFVVIGHVDHGKSTLMGRLLLDVGAVSQRDIDKYQKQASEMGKASFALAWVMDTSAEERERGVTFDFAQHHFSTPKADFTILDAPGHRDFVPNMIGGASMADMAVLVVDANQLDSGMKGQTREHILLAKAVGLKKVVVAINKLDAATPPWSQQLFESVQTDIKPLLATSGFADEDIKFIPCSGLAGTNVVNPPKPSSPAAWIPKSHFTLLQALERSIPTPAKLTTTAAAAHELLKQPLRMQIIDVFRGSITNPLSIAGRIASGTVQIGDLVMIQPSGEKAAVKALDVSDEPRDYAVVGQICTLHLSDIEAQHLRSGDVVCASQHPVRVAKSCTVLIEVLEALLPQPVDVHFGRLHVPGRISQLVETVDGKGEQLKRRPKVLKAGQRARVRVGFEEGVPLVVGERVVLRSAGVTAAYGRME
ncbi:hypothetical protein LTR82_002470 [Friedmanniomyces endolithicus]|uniref:Tr-type G domain-containing protein n=1 Tax=Friedmanniomyces endolithicus TaxID=329885 RepID=A0AAN6FY83_9PEZI|nr:hypothetical protein LTR82_002470 [Friedmanniomyces endolithicus]